MYDSGLPDGYERTGRTPMEIRLIDPEVCPAGHPMRLVRRGWSHCALQHHHESWTCACGQEVWRVGGVFIDDLGYCTRSRT
jgi:hypothetical protein